MASCGHAGCVQRRLCRIPRRRAYKLEWQRAYRRTPAGRLTDNKGQTRKWRRELREGIARKKEQIAELESQLGLTPRIEVVSDGAVV